MTKVDKRNRRSVRGVKSHHEVLEPRFTLAGDLVSQWQAETLAASVSDGSTITQWPDAVKGTLAMASGSPKFIRSAIGGRAAVRFDASDGTDLLRIERLQSPLSGAGDFSIVLVFRTSATNQQGGEAEWYKNTALVDASSLGVTFDWGLSLNAAGRVAAGLGRGFGTPPVNLYSSQMGLNDGLFHVVNLRRSGAHLVLQVDEQPAVEIDAHASPLASLDLILGGQKFGAFGYTGDLAELRVYSGALDDSQSSALHNELRAFYSNARPVATDDRYSLAEDSGLFAQTAATGVLVNDHDRENNPLRAELVETTAHGHLVLRADGSFIYDPDENYFGVDSFRYTANDLQASDPVIVTLDVVPVYDAPSPQSDRYTALPSDPLVVPAIDGLLANDTNPDRAPLRVILGRDVDHGVLQLHDDGSFQYDARGYEGIVGFTYRLEDGRQTSAETNVELVVTSAPIRISEFSAANATLLPTRTRDSVEGSFSGPTTTPDWIELENLHPLPIELDGYHLTDDARQPTKWTFPKGTIVPGGGHLIVYASELNLLDPTLDETGRLHTNFSLSRDGEYLAVNFPGGAPIHEFSPTYAAQRTDVSYGWYADQMQYFPTPTPGATNSVGISEVTRDTSFSHGRGFYDAPFDLEITSETPGAAVIYTVNGSEPSVTNGTRVDAVQPDVAPFVRLSITKTTIVRALAVHDGMLSSSIQTETYLFLSDIVKQSTLSNTIKNNATWGPQLDDALLALPSISIASGGRFSEREVGTSVELVFPDGTKGFQIDAGLEHFGGTSLTSSPKKSMRLSFKSKWGAGSLKYDLFGRGSVDEFEQLLLRSGSHDTWLWTHPDGGRGNFLRNRWASDRQLEMGELAPHGRFVHVYINGVYWGLHELMERPEADFMASYAGGLASDYDVLNAGLAVDGTVATWRDMRQNAVIDDYQKLQQYLDVENYADYMLLQFYAGNDWDWNSEQNWMAARRREEGAGFVFFSWDGDVMLRTTATANVINRGGPSNLWGANGGVKQHPEFIQMMADRAQRYFFDGGMFSDERLRADMEQLAAIIRLPMIAESARWGGAAYTPTIWEGAVQWMLDRFAPLGAGGRAETVVEQMRRAGIFPAINAPRVLVNGVFQQEAFLGANDRVTISADQGVVYFTLDGSDPRLAGGAVAPTAVIAGVEPIGVTQSSRVRARALKDGVWSTLREVPLHVNTVRADSSNVRIAEIQYHPADPTAAEQAAGFADADAFEYLELVNLSSSTLDLRQVEFVQTTANGQVEGVAFAFAGSHVEFLPPRARVVVVEDEAAFRLRYGDRPLVAGAWNGSLSNSGESLVLIAGEETIHDFAYSDRWWSDTDGDGRSLQAVFEGNGDRTAWSRSDGWRVSRRPLGSPGSVDALVGDANLDGIFDSQDLVLIFAAGEYEDGVGNNSVWEDGDWNDDGEFDSADLVAAFSEGAYAENLRQKKANGWR